MREQRAVPPPEDGTSGDGRHPRPAALLIAGPTASGKSALALRLARALGGTIVNADSMQVYRDLRLISARPSEEETAQAPHRLYGETDGATNYSVGRFAKEASDVLADLSSEGRLPILVGGTGLYFRALEEGLSDLPPIPDAVRDSVRLQAEGRASEALHADLGRLDPVGAATLRPSDRLRIMRALEVFTATGKPIAAFQGNRRPGPLHGRDLVRVFLSIDRDVLRRRIDARFIRMVEAGALREVAALRARRLDPMLPVMRAVGVPPLLAHLDGTLSLDEAVARGQGDTRRYAKRQFTWFRHQMGTGWTWADPEAAYRSAMERFSAPAGR